jgi:MFS family permease
VSVPPADEQPPEEGRLRPTSPAAITAWAVAGLIGGWLLHPITERVSGTAPVLTWAQPLALALVAAILGATAWLTWRTVHVQRRRLEPHRAVNRLVLARACALVGALVAGAYLGYAVSWLGDDAELAAQRAWRSGASSLAGMGIVITAVLLERACRVRSDDGEP